MKINLFYKLTNYKSFIFSYFTGTLSRTYYVFYCRLPLIFLLFHYTFFPLNTFPISISNLHKSFTQHTYNRVYIYLAHFTHGKVRMCGLTLIYDNSNYYMYVLSLILTTFPIIWLVRFYDTYLSLKQFSLA